MGESAAEGDKISGKLVQEPSQPTVGAASKRGLSHWSIVKLPLIGILPLLFLRRRKEHRVNRIYFLMTVFGTFFGTLLVLLAMAASYGTANDAVRTISGINSHIIVSTVGVGDVCDMPRVENIIRGAPHVVATAPYLIIQGIVITRERDNAPVPLLLKGIDPQRELAATGLGQSVQRSVIQELDGSYTDTVPLVLSKGLADRLLLSPGSVITLTLKNPAGDRDFQAQLIGTFRPEARQLQQMAYTSISAARIIGRTPEPCIKGFGVRGDDAYSAPAIAKSLAASLGRGYLVKDWTIQFADYWTTLVLMQRLVFGLKIGVICLGVIYSFSTILLVAHEKRKDAAVLLTLGMSPRSIRCLFTNLALVLGLLGIGLAAIVIRPACWAMNHYRVLRLPADMTVISHVSFHLPVSQEISLYVMELILLTVYGWFLSSDIGRISAARVLRDE